MTTPAPGCNGTSYTILKEGTGAAVAKGAAAEQRARLIRALVDHAGLSESKMRYSAGTGLIVDIPGPTVENGKVDAVSTDELPFVKTIALRAVRPP